MIFIFFVFLYLYHKMQTVALQTIILGRKSILINQTKQRTLSLFMIVLTFVSLIYPLVPGIVVNADEDSAETNRTVRLVYEREDGDYEDWDVWVWNTGVKEDDIQFDNYDNGVATAFIEVVPNADEIGYIEIGRAHV